MDDIDVGRVVRPGVDEVRPAPGVLVPRNRDVGGDGHRRGGVDVDAAGGRVATADAALITGVDGRDLEAHVPAPEGLWIH